ncbi:Lar family restriction alleviation protein [Paraburkholderia graminis]|uniref:Lar family restriction alleviation protein n=1 Tax=Paraburkholderia graminis TaxID=60548 RepID=UPI0038B7EEC0
MNTTNHTSPSGEELKPCPFCGETPTMWGKAKVRVECSNADCFVSVHLVPASSEADAISLWNRRAQPIGEDAVNGAIGEREAWLEELNALVLEYGNAVLVEGGSSRIRHIKRIMDHARAALTAEKVAAEPVAWAAGSLYDAIEEVLLSHKLSNWQDQYEGALGLVDRLCDADAHDISSGQHAIRLICDEIYNEVLTVAAPQPAQTQVALSDADMLALIRKVEHKLGIVWFVPDDSGRCLWRTTDTEERNKFVRTLLSMHSAPTNAIGDAARDVIVERQRQMSAEGWTPEHDDEHEIGELARAAACYAANATGFRLQSRLNIWPWDREWWKPTTPRRDLIKAGALILAEIERIDRAAVQPAGGTDHE